MNEKEYIKSLENVLSQYLKPLKDIPFKLVMKSLSGFEILNFDINTKQNKKLLKDLIKACELVKKEVNKNGLAANRPNEIGNYIEPFLKDSLNKQNLLADTPKLRNNKKKSIGYPDLEFKDNKGCWYYLECKTFNINNIATTQRSFFVSPSNNFKITKDAIHFLISFQIEQNNKNYIVKNYKILTLENLKVDLKNEFNTNNKNLYSKENILYESQYQ